VVGSGVVTLLLHVQDLTIEYLTDSGPVRVLEGVSFSMAAGEAVGMLGDSGCGKTTLLLSILGLLPWSARILSGSILFQGQQLVGLNEPAFRSVRGREIALIPQEPALALNPVIRAGEQLADVVHAHDSRPWKECRRKAKRLLPCVGLMDVERIYQAYPHQLSGGQRQRVAIAQAIACGPALLLADEPTTSLDTTTQAEILALLRCLRQGRGMGLFLVSHDPTILSEVTSRILVLHQGRIVEDALTADAFSRPASLLARSLLDAVPHPVMN
jgi:ABC-type glutathione transport system ATPase component